MFDSYKASAAQQKLCEEKGYPHFAPNERIQFKCYRCGQNIFAAAGHPIAEKLRGGRVRLDFSREYEGISVERAGSTLICGCPFCGASFDD